MDSLHFDLYIDESGDFENDDVNLQLNPSLVGGLLCPSTTLSDSFFDEYITDQIHAMEHYDKATFFQILLKLRELGCHFVIFNNEERIKVINGDFTYLNIISEGLVHLMRDIRMQYPSSVVYFHILIASRQAMSYKKDINLEGTNIRIEQNEYFKRIEEKIQLAMGRAELSDVKYQIKYANAKYNKRLMLADIICNTYITRNGRKKFTNQDRALINQHFYEQKYIYSVFENATLGQIKRFLFESRLGEAMSQLCVLPELGKATELRNMILQWIAKSSGNEQKAYFQYMSLQISQYNYLRMHPDGIAFAENYKTYILQPLMKYENADINPRALAGLKKAIKYWIFDTDFFILTMYDHIGYTTKCGEYLSKCKENIDAIDMSWEHIDYYFRFRIRELNCLVGRFDFEEALRKSEELLHIFDEAKELFKMIGAYEGTNKEPTSALLGKTHGIRLECYINLIHKDPRLIDAALNSSDLALSEFDTISDLQRQYQYRCMLLVAAHRLEEAVTYLLKAAQIDQTDKDSFIAFLSQAYLNRRNPNLFLIMHYTNVLILAQQENSPVAAQMASAILAFEPLMQDLFNNENTGRPWNDHPWNLILWNMSKYFRSAGEDEKSEKLYRHAMDITTKHAEKSTMFSFALSMSAEYVCYCKANKPSQVSAALREYKAMNQKFYGIEAELPVSMRTWFPKSIGDISYEEITNISLGYLK